MRLLSVQDALLFRFRLIIPAFFRNFVQILYFNWGQDWLRRGSLPLVAIWWLKS